MVRNPNILFLYQAFVAFLGLALACVGFVTAWTFFCLRDSRELRGPGLNLKDL